MIALSAGVRVYLACGVTDMRKGMTGLAMLVQQGLSADPFLCGGRDYVAEAAWRQPGPAPR
jgi:transposase